MQSPDGNHVWCPSQSLWSLITEHVTEPELPKIRTALGNSLVDMYTDVHTEALMWYKVWQERQQGNSSSRAGSPRRQPSPLADPPGVKELVRAEVKMLLQTLRERASRVRRDGEELVFRYKPKTVDYALGHVDSCYKNLANPEDTDIGSRPSSHCSARSTAEDEIEAVRDKLNVSDIDQVVDRLRSVLTEECEALSRLVKCLQGNIKLKCHFDAPEPTLAELRHLRGAIQTDLELYPSSFAASPPASSALPLKESKGGFRLSAGQRLSEEPLQALSTTSAYRPHPLPPLCHTKPRPPMSAPPSKPSVKLMNSSLLSRTHGQHRVTSSSNGPKKTQMPFSIISSGHFTPSPPGPASDQMIETTRHCSLSPEQDSVGVHCRSPTSSRRFGIKSPSNPTIHKPHPSSHCSIGSPGRKGDLSPQTETSGINTISSRIPALSSLCTPESFKSLVGSRKSSTGIVRNKNAHLGNDVTQQQSAVATV